LIFTRAIVRAVPETIDAGITSANLGKPDYERACEQHDRYVGALERCGLEVSVLGADARYPDSVFIEDTAVVTDRCAIIANPGAVARRGEVREVEEVLSGLYENVERIVSPGTLDGGDVLQIGDHFYIGLTRRTNREGAGQLSAILRGYGFGASFVELRRFLHLKTGVAYPGGDDLVVAGELVGNSQFGGFDKIVVPPEEEYCANCIRVNDHILLAAGCKRTKEKIIEKGYEVIELEMSEFRKVDGGLSCLSLRLAGTGKSVEPSRAMLEGEEP
jgi:dimethylargininase